MPLDCRPRLFMVKKCLDLGSLHAGGATFLPMATDCPELVMRSGRWLAHRTMDVYLQELNATVYFPRLPSTVKERALELAHSLPALLSSLGSLLQSKVAPELWYAVLTKKDTDGKNGRNVPGRSAGGKALHREKQTWMRQVS